MFESKIFESKCTVLKKVLVTLLAFSGGPQRFGARGIVAHLYYPFVTPLSCVAAGARKGVRR